MRAKNVHQLIVSKDGSVHDRHPDRPHEPEGPCLGYVRRLRDNRWEALLPDETKIHEGRTRSDCVTELFYHHDEIRLIIETI